ncbi:alkaline phosphatase D family protein [Mycobacterium gordonae]|uniref:Phosphodiesterase n=1 Tax=Mycobacterium gordonae TaxID=1778 RepID=A0A1X1VKH3_MYCGO|nr:alkaline phosphatase D family protein [Mycobacterium gordonae]MCQ4360046.1 alkaline phosphatase family protein [Mycobacterium gordonae]MCV7009384.1 alkaline phosphatase family protein [Mycobacterium gordonae]ODR18853.1 phosphodiesterase [Mycobacterium gordonae]ORV69504.1 phosphodiesterase [Mycobacterium gordonae]
MALLLGPALRHVSDTTALVWVQTDGAATVEVLGASARTFAVQGYHYALVTVTGLAPDSVTEYDVKCDGDVVWPLPDSPFPPSVIRTRGPASTHRLQAIFGSCRYPKTDDPSIESKLELDALDVYAARMATRPIDDWPEAVIMLGDQLYADELTPEARQRLAGRRSRTKRAKRPPDEVVSFAEYERLYRHSWSDPEIRWLMSTVPTAMIFDDHDIRDDWNTSASWRADMKHQPWWRDRIRAGLASYWVYQHLGNLSPAELADDEDYRRLVTTEGDCWPFLVELADRADEEVDHTKGVRFSYRWDFGRSRLIMIDSRNGRILDTGQRMMIGEREFSWVEAQVADGLEQLDHLMLASSVPWLMPPALGDLEAVNERNADRAGLRGRLAEKTRRAVDFEHWPAFYKSFERLAEMIYSVASHPHGPATVNVLSGDVHHSYAARVEWAGESAGATVHQLVCSPVNNYVPAFVKPVFTLAWTRPAAKLARWWARLHRVPDLPLSWTNTCGPLFGNTIATLLIDGRGAEVLFEQPRGTAALDEVGRVRLSRPS